MQTGSSLKLLPDSFLKLVYEAILRPGDVVPKNLEFSRALRNGAEIYILHTEPADYKLLTIKLPNGTRVVLDETSVISSAPAGVVMLDDYYIVILENCTIKAWLKGNSSYLRRDIEIDCGERVAKTTVEIFFE